MFLKFGGGKMHLFCLLPSVLAGGGVLVTPSPEVLGAGGSRAGSQDAGNAAGGKWRRKKGEERALQESGAQLAPHPLTGSWNRGAFHPAACGKTSEWGPGLSLPLRGVRRGE